MEKKSTSFFTRDVAESDVSLDDVTVGEDGAIELSGGIKRRESMLGNASETGREMKIDLSFQDLSVTLVSGLKILQGITGTLESGKMTAIIGPSGFGKSTLLNALTNRIRDGGRVGGRVWINGERRNLQSIQHLVGFVPQEDVMYRDLTVRETLRFNARLKADPRMGRNERRAFVNEVVDILGLKHVQHSVIGDENTRGISGGQRKRVNIGIELMSSPLILFLDEPTSGLDSTTTQLLIDSLEKLAQLGLTIAMVIHQPRMEVLNKIHNLILLQRGGYEVYVGETKNALDYFGTHCGNQIPNQTSPADFFLDVVTEDQTKFDSLDEEGTTVAKWAEYKKSQPAYRYDRDEYRDRIVPARHRPGRIYQTRTVYKRSVIQMFNASGTHFTDALLYIIAGAVAGIVASDDTFMGNQIVMMITGMISVVAALKVFSGEMHIFKRDMMAGVSSLAYFVGKVLAHFPLVCISPIFFLSTYFRMAYPNNTLGDLYIIILCGMFSGTGLGYFISSTMNEKNATILGVISGLMGILFAGLNPALKDLVKTPIGWFMTTFNYGSWFTGALFVRECKYIFAAGFKESIRWLEEKGYHDVQQDDVFSQADIYKAQLRLAEIYREKLWFMVSQYAWYMVAAYFVFLYQAKKEQGMLALGPIVFTIRNNVYDPLMNFVKYGQFSTEISRREKDEIDEKRRVARERKKTEHHRKKEKKKAAGHLGSKGVEVGGAEAPPGQDEV
jgi:ABC-type multidrug transport system ATPase subunit